MAVLQCACACTRACGQVPFKVQGGETQESLERVGVGRKVRSKVLGGLSIDRELVAFQARPGAMVLFKLLFAFWSIVHIFVATGVGFVSVVMSGLSFACSVI